jgi:hypothetical protein
MKWRHETSGEVACARGIIEPSSRGAARDILVEERLSVVLISMSRTRRSSHDTRRNQCDSEVPTDEFSSGKNNASEFQSTGTGSNERGRKFVEPERSGKDECDVLMSLWCPSQILSHLGGLWDMWWHELVVDSEVDWQTVIKTTYPVSIAHSTVLPLAFGNEIDSRLQVGEHILFP